MKRKSILKKGLMLLTVFVMVFCMVMNVAAAATLVTTTTYNIGDDTATVTTNVTDLSGEEQEVVYVAYNKDVAATPTESSIVYIDQASVNASSTSCSFTYVADVDKIGSTYVKVGTDSAAQTVTNSDTLALKALGVVVSKTGNGTVTPISSMENSLYALQGKTATFTITPADGSKLGSLSYNGNPVNLSTLIPNAQGVITYGLTNVVDGATLDVVFVENTDVTSRVSKGAKYNTSGSSAAAYSKLHVPGSVGNSQVSGKYQYGMIFSYNILTNADKANIRAVAASWWTNAVSEMGNAGDKSLIKKFQAFSKGSDGVYAVQLNDNGSGLLTGIYYMTPYLIEKDGDNYTVTFGEPVAYNVE